MKKCRSEFRNIRFANCLSVWAQLPLQEGKIRFKTILDDTIENEELLQPIFADELTQWLTQIGFQAINLYGNFKKDPFDKEKSMALIITAEK